MSDNRIRVNFSVTSKGVVTPDVTVELGTDDRSRVLVEATRLLDEALVIARERCLK